MSFNDNINCNSMGESSKRPRLNVPMAQTNNLELNDLNSSNTIFGRVSNSVHGMFSNSSFSEWWKSSDDQANSPVIQSSNNSLNVSSDLSHKSKSFTQIYPEEGTSDSMADNANCATNEPSNQPFIPRLSHGSQTLISSPSHLASFSRTKPMLSSTPSISPAFGRNTGVDKFMSDSMIGQPSTSRHNITTSDNDTFYLLKRAFPENTPESFHSNQAQETAYSSRKRVREEDIFDVCEDKRVKDDLTSPSLYTLGQTNDTSDIDTSQFEGQEMRSRKRPRFSISAYGSPFTSSQRSRETPSSIFYPGKVMYGGAANYQRRRNKIVPRKIVPRQATSSICGTSRQTPLAGQSSEPSSSDPDGDAGLSSAARRILECIDKISTPLSESKRARPSLPLGSLGRRSSFDSFAVLDQSPYVADFHRHRPPATGPLRQQKATLPPTNKLLTPAKAVFHKSVSSMLALEKVPNFNPPTNCSSLLTPEVSPASILSNQLTSTRDVAKSGADLISQPKPLFNFANPTTFSASEISFGKATTSRPQKLEKVVDLKKQVNESKQATSSYFGLSKNDTKTCVLLYEEDDINFKSSDNNFEFSAPEVISKSSMSVTNEVVDEFAFSQPIDRTNSETSSIDPSNLWDKLSSQDGWECDICMLHNKAAAFKCIACETPKATQQKDDQKNKSKESSFKDLSTFIGSSSALPITSSWGVKTADGSWECDTCLLRNAADLTTCVACLAQKPNENCATFFTPKPICNNNATNGWSEISNTWGDVFKPAEGSWECSACLLQNQGSVNACAACETSKVDIAKTCETPKTAVAKTNSETPINQSVAPSTWGDAFKPVVGQWECGVCMLSNDATKTACVACESVKPGCAAECTPKDVFGRPLTSTQQVKRIQVDTTPKWTCESCSTKNNEKHDTCIGCRKPKISAEFVSSGESSNFGGLSQNLCFGGVSARNEWECKTCLVRNKGSLRRCVSCDTPQMEDNYSLKLVSEAITGKFKFGVPKITTESLKTTSTVTSATVAPKFDWNKNVPKPDLLSKVVSTPATTVSSASPSTFSFFKAPLKTTQASTPIQKSTTQTALTGATTSALQTSSTPVLPIFTTPTTTVVTSTPSLATVASSNGPLIATKPVFTFGVAKKAETSKLSLPEITKTEAPKLAFPKVENKQASSFSFSSTATPVSAASSLTLPTKEAALPLFTFGSASSTIKPSPGFVFGAQSTTNNKVSFDFGAAPAPDNKGSTPFVFGAPSSTPTQPPSLPKPPSSFSFGKAEPSALFQFGNQNSQPAINMPAKAADPSMPPPFFNAASNETPNNLFSAMSSPAGQRRFKKAVRRNK